MMHKPLAALILALVALQQLAACQAAELTGTAKEALKQVTGDAESSTADKAAGSQLTPVLVLRKQTRDEKPDFFLVWMKPYEQFIPKPMQDMLDSQVRPQTEQISGQIISNVPGAEQAWSQMSQIQNMIGQLGLGSMLGGGSGSSSGGNSLSSLMQNLGRRRR